MKKSILGIMSLIMVISAFTSCGNTAKNANSKPKVKVKKILRVRQMYGLEKTYRGLQNVPILIRIIQM